MSSLKNSPSHAEAAGIVERHCQVLRLTCKALIVCESYLLVALAIVFYVFEVFDESSFVANCYLVEVLEIRSIVQAQLRDYLTSYAARASKTTE